MENPSEDKDKVEISYLVKGKIRVDTDDIARLGKLGPAEGVNALFENGYDIKTMVMGAPGDNAPAKAKKRRAKK